MHRDADMRVLRALLDRPDYPVTVADLEFLTRRGRRSVQKALCKLHDLGLAGRHGRSWLWNPESLSRPYGDRPRPRGELLRASQPVTRDLDLGLTRLFLSDPHGWWTAAECALFAVRPVGNIRRVLHRLFDAGILMRDPGLDVRRLTRYKLNPSLAMALLSERGRLLKTFKEWNYE
jgi:hypothetical protein